MAKTTFEEEVYLRALTGRIVGRALYDLGFHRLAVAALKNVICSSLAAATEAAFLEHGGVTRHFAVEPGGEAEAAGRLASWRPQATLIQFGGEATADVVKRSTAAFIEALAEEGAAGDVVIHVRTLAAGGLDEALKSGKARSYLAERGVYTYTVDFELGFIVVNKVKISGEKYELEPIRQYPVTLEHADLLNRSIRGKTVTFA